MLSKMSAIISPASFSSLTETPFKSRYSFSEAECGFSVEKRSFSVIPVSSSVPLFLNVNMILSSEISAVSIFPSATSL